MITTLESGQAYILDSGPHALRATYDDHGGSSRFGTVRMLSGHTHKLTTGPRDYVYYLVDITTGLPGL